MSKRSAASAHDGRAARSARRTTAPRKIDIPETSDAQFRAMRRIGRPPIGAHARRLIAIRLDPEVLKRFRTEARRRNVGYQTLIHRVLAEYIRKHVA